MISARPSTEYGIGVCFISYQGLAVQIKSYSGFEVIYLVVNSASSTMGKPLTGLPYKQECLRDRFSDLFCFFSI